VGVALLVGSLGLAAACEREPTTSDAEALPTTMSGAEAAGTERATVLGSFLEAHWQLPIPAQGEPPAGFSEAEASLQPATCGGCHPRQLAEWQTSLHAAAFSPGFAGQLLEGGLATPGAIRNCQTCHTPLAEQQPFGADHETNPGFDPGLREQGLVCAACHVRAHRRLGPPPRADAAPPSEPVPHAGFEVRAEFQKSEFCAPCHQFFDDAGVNGKPLENTYLEWRASPQAGRNQTCQSCHMPDRAHVWRGIHDADMVRDAVDVDLVVADAAQGDGVRAALVVENRAVGHAFPTYVTPRVFLAVWQTDESGREIEGTRAEASIGREIDFGTSPWREVFDTRVAPGKSVKLDYSVARAPGATALLGRVSVDPDHHYRGVFESLRNSYRDPEARALIEEAYRRSQESSYVLVEIRRAL
jgi:GNAT superfamily N-acetyltransferase